MTTGCLITQFHRARRQADWVGQLCLLRALTRHGAEALARLRRSVGLTPREFATLRAVAGETSYVFFDHTLTLDHHRTALAARALFAPGTVEQAPRWWVSQARRMGWTPRQLAWAMRHPAAVKARALAARQARRQLESRLLRFNQRHGRMAGRLVLAPAPLTEQGAS